MYAPCRLEFRRHDTWSPSRELADRVKAAFKRMCMLVCAKRLSEHVGHALSRLTALTYTENNDCASMADGRVHVGTPRAQSTGRQRWLLSKALDVTWKRPLPFTTVAAVAPLHLPHPTNLSGILLCNTMYCVHTHRNSVVECHPELRSNALVKKKGVTLRNNVGAMHRCDQTVGPPFESSTSPRRTPASGHPSGGFRLVLPRTRY